MDAEYAAFMKRFEHEIYGRCGYLELKKFLQRKIAYQNSRLSRRYLDLGIFILKECRDNVQRLYSQRGLTLSAQNGGWEYAWPGNPGYPFLLFEPNPSDLNFTGGRNWSWATTKKFYSCMTTAIYYDRVDDMIDLFLLTCPNSWKSAWGPLTERILRNARRGIILSCDPRELIRYHWELGLWFDYIIHFLQLPLPNGERCMMFNQLIWSKNLSQSEKHRYYRISRVATYFSGSDWWPRPTTEQGVPFSHCRTYMATALADLDLPLEEVFMIARDVVKFMGCIKKSYERRTVGEKGVRLKGQNWVDRIGYTHSILKGIGGRT